MHEAGWLLCGIAVLVVLVSAIGLIRLPDALSRQHAATKATTVAVIIFAIGTMLIKADPAWSWRVLVILVLLFITLPIASHMLGRAAYREMSQRDGAGD